MRISTRSKEGADSNETAALAHETPFAAALPATMGLVVLLGTATPTFAQTPAPRCNPDAGRDRSRIECLTKIVHWLSEQVVSLRAKSSASRESHEERFVTPPELDARLAGYVKFEAPLAINLLAEPSTSENDGRCLEGFPGEVGVIAHAPCNYQTKQQMQWRLLPIPRDAAVNR